jgi:hypothetical protein
MRPRSLFHYVIGSFVQLAPGTPMQRVIVAAHWSCVCEKMAMAFLDVRLLRLLPCQGAQLP